MTRYFNIKGGEKLTGSIKINGAKNSILPLLISSTMTNKVVTIEDVPKISDVEALVKIFTKMGSNIIQSTNGPRDSIIIDNESLDYMDLYMPEVSQFRASYYLIGALIGRYKKCNLLLPGGCFLGPRPIDLHLKGFEALGCVIEQENEEGANKLMISAPNGIHGADIFLDFPSVGATINIMLAATLAEGETIIENAAKEPEIVDVATMLTNMGAKIKGAGTNEIRIMGVEELHGCVHQTVPDRIEAGTYLMIGALLGENFTVENIIPEHLEALISKLSQVGIKLDIGDDYIKIIGRNEKLTSANIKVGVYPSFPTDLQQIFITLLTQVEGSGKVVETIFPDRFRQCEYLKNMGADIKLFPGEELAYAEVHGPTKLKGASVRATDLRAGASLVFAGLLAEGETRIDNIEHVLRGYDEIVKKLTNVGANITLVEE